MHHRHGDGQAPWMPECWNAGMLECWNAGMSECWHAGMLECQNADKKFSPASLVFRQFITLSPASAFRHRGQSDTASHGLVRQCPAIYINNIGKLQYDSKEASDTMPGGGQLWLFSLHLGGTVGEGKVEIVQMRKYSGSQWNVFPVSVGGNNRIPVLYL